MCSSRAGRRRRKPAPISSPPFCRRGGRRAKITERSEAPPPASRSTLLPRKRGFSGGIFENLSSGIIGLMHFNSLKHVFEMQQVILQSLIVKLIALVPQQVFQQYLYPQRHLHFSQVFTGSLQGYQPQPCQPQRFSRQAACSAGFNASTAARAPAESNASALLEANAAAARIPAAITMKPNLRISPSRGSSR